MFHFFLGERGTDQQERRERRKNLKEARQRAGLTQQQMADRLGIDIRYYKSIGGGQVVGNVELWDELEDLFRVHQRVLRENHQEPAVIADQQEGS